MVFMLKGRRNWT